MEFLQVKETKVYCLLETVCFCYRLVSLAFFFLHFWPSCYPFLVRDTLGLVLGKCCKVRHSVTKHYKQLHIKVRNITYV